MKALKIIGKILLLIVGIVVVIVVTLPFWISPVARIGANIAVPKATGSAFHLDRFNLSADWLSLATDTVVVKDISVGGLYYEYKLSMSSFTFGGSKKEGGAKKEEPKVQEPAKSAEPKTPKKVIIDHLLLEDIVISVNGLKIPLPKIELSGIGRKSNGVTMEEAWEQISTQVMEKANALGVNLNELTKKIDIEQINKAVDAIKSIDTKELNKALDGSKDAVDKVGKSASQAVEMLGKGAGNTAGSVSEGASKAVNKVSEGTGNAVDKVSEGASKAVEKTTEQVDKTVNALKGLFGK